MGTPEVLLERWNSNGQWCRAVGGTGGELNRTRFACVVAACNKKRAMPQRSPAQTKNTLCFDIFNLI